MTTGKLRAWSWGAAVAGALACVGATPVYAQSNEANSVRSPGCNGVFAYLSVDPAAVRTEGLIPARWKLTLGSAGKARLFLDTASCQLTLGVVTAPTHAQAVSAATLRKPTACGTCRGLTLTRSRVGVPPTLFTHLPHRGHRHRRQPPAAKRAPAHTELWRECAAYARQHVNTDTCAADAAAARAAIAKYRDINAAITDGFVPLTDCVSSPAGAMGEHWARLERMVTGVLDVTAPQMLLYLPTPAGRVLLGAEYEQTAMFDGLPWWGPTQPAGTVSPRPSMFGGKSFDGPMAGHSPVQPWHYDLHVWLAKTNPAGLFAEYNRSLSC